jgi:hypothetical protein
VHVALPHTYDDVHRHEHCKPHGEQATQHARRRITDAWGREVGIKL